VLPQSTVPKPRPFHAVRFYNDAEGLSAIVAGFLTQGFTIAQAAIVIGTPAHRAAIEERLAAAGFDPTQLKREGRLFVLDAQEVLERILVDGMPNASAFEKAIVPIIEEASGGRRDCVVRAYGEMVDVLWRAGQTAAAIRLETLWNTLANTQSFSLLCGYSMGNFYKNAAIEEICSHHSHVMSSHGEAAEVH